MPERSVLGHTCIVSSIFGLYSTEMKDSPPHSSVDFSAAREPLSVHIIVTQLSIVNLGYSCAVRVRPKKSLQFIGTVSRSVLRSAPNADRLVSTKDHWTGECRAVLRS